MALESLDRDLIGIHESFAATDHGQQLAINVRYNRYKPSDVSNARWVKLLGADVNNLTHLPLTYGLTRSFIIHQEVADPNYFSDQEKEILLVSALIHDWAESIVGDLSYDEKTEQDEAEEITAFDRNLANFYPAGSSNIREKIITARNEVIYNQDSRLGRVFNSIERVGYIRTALRASSQIGSGNAVDCEDGFRWIVADVFGNQIVPTLRYTEDYQPVYLFMANQIGKITTAFEVVNPQVFDNYDESQRAQEQNDFINARTAWDIWAA